MPKYRYLLIFVVVFTLLFSGWYIFKNSQVKSAVVVKEEVMSPLPVVTNKTFSYACEGGKSAFEVLEENSEIEFSESTMGKLVTSINGQSQEGGKYWLYSIDGQEATVGASTYICRDSEEILWELK